MITISEYLLGKNKVATKHVHNETDLFAYDSLNKISKLYEETYWNLGEKQMKCLDMYEKYMSTHTYLEDLIDYLADIAKKYINGYNESYVALSTKSKDTHKFNAERYIIRLRFNADIFINIILWRGYNLIGFYWGEGLTKNTLKYYTLDFNGTKGHRFNVVEKTDENYCGDIEDAEVMDEITNQIDKIIKVKLHK